MFDEAVEVSNFISCPETIDGVLSKTPLGCEANTVWNSDLVFVELALDSSSHFSWDFHSVMDFLRDSLGLWCRQCEILSVILRSFEIGKELSFESWTGDFGRSSGRNWDIKLVREGTSMCFIVGNCQLVVLLIRSKVAVGFLSDRFDCSRYKPCLIIMVLKLTKLEILWIGPELIVMSPASIVH